MADLDLDEMERLLLDLLARVETLEERADKPVRDGHPLWSPAVIVDPSQPVGSFAVVSQSERVEVVNVGAAPTPVTREVLATAVREASASVCEFQCGGNPPDHSTECASIRSLLARLDAEKEAPRG